MILRKMETVSDQNETASSNLRQHRINSHAISSSTTSDGSNVHHRSSWTSPWTRMVLLRNDDDDSYQWGNSGSMRAFCCVLCKTSAPLGVSCPLTLTVLLHHASATFLLYFTIAWSSFEALGLVFFCFSSFPLSHLPSFELEFERLSLSNIRFFTST